MLSPTMLSLDQLDQFRRDGFLLVPSFYNVESDIAPICFGIYEICRLVANDHRPEIQIPPFSLSNFDAGYRRLISIDRRLGGIVYDAVKQLPAFMRLLVDQRHESLVKQLGQSNLPGIAASSYGIRIDNPGEVQFNSIWHNDYFSNLRSSNGLVFWASLVPFTQQMGPVILCRGSHLEPNVRLRLKPGVNISSIPTYQELSNKFEIYELEKILARYEQVAPLAQLGDLLIIDFKTIHSSGQNCSQSSRWSMQMRWFGFDDESGRKINWSGSFSAGVDFRKIHPEMIVND